jgi:hypothetical protein
MEQEINFIYDYYDKIAKALDYNIHPKTIINLPNKIDIYTKLYKFCIDKDDNTDKMYNAYKDILNDYCVKFDNTNLSIKNIVDFIENYDTLIKYLYFAFNYLDKHYIKHNELTNLKKDLPNIILLEKIIDSNFDKIKQEIKLIINQIRVSSYNHIQELIYKTKLNVFLKIIENKDANNVFINRLNQEIFISTDYYQSIDLDYQNNSAEFILEKLNNIWNSEKNIYLELCPSYLPKIEKNFKSITIKDKIDLLLNNNFTGISRLLDNKNFNSLIFLIQNVSLDENIEKNISDKISNYFYDNNKRLLDLKLSINNIINTVECYDQYCGFLKSINSQIFIEDVNNKMDALVNSNVKYINIIIDLFNSSLKENKSISEFEILIDFIKFYKDPDYFYCLYQTKLENRLFNNQTNYQVESDFFYKLVNKFPYRKSTKILTLIQDIESSKNFNYELKNLCNFTDDNFNLRILTTTYWNINKDGYFKEINLDDDNYKHNLLLTQELFNLKYNGLRKLYINQLKGEIEIDFNSNKITTIPIIASVLLCFNNVDINSFEELLEKTNIKKDILSKIVKLLVDSNILLHLADNMYNINCNFNNNNFKLDFNDIEEESDKIEDSFKTIRIEAALVKIMKQRQSLEIDKLILETKERLSHFNPDENIIKKVLNELIEREYFEDNNGIIKYENL